MRGKLANFANANEQQAYDLRLGTGRLGVIQFVMPSGGFDSNSEFAFDAESTNLNELKRILSPVERKVSWK
jgi:hypothetical protein